MKQNAIDLNRRKILKKSLFGMTAIAASSIISVRAYADELPDLSEDDPIAMGLHYKKDTTTVDATKHAKHTPDQNCANCILYNSKTDEAGLCTIFAGKQVRAEGWCTAYAKKA